MNYLNDLESEDRYGLQTFLHVTEEGNFITVDSVFINDLRELAPQAYTVCRGERPDKLAYDIYGDTQYTWILMLYNNCIDIEDGTFESGKMIKYPSINDLEKIIFTLKARQRAEEASRGELEK